MKLRDAGIYNIVNLFKGEATTMHGYGTSGSIINPQKSRVINIPAYQRPYRWGSDNIKRLFTDYYDDNDGEYFLGSAVAVEKTDNSGLLQFDIVDGQQRITTLYLLNYIRFLLMRERLHLAIEKKLYTRLSDYCAEMKKCYVNLIGKGNTERFDKLSDIISSLDEIEDADEKYKTIRTGFDDCMCYVLPMTTEEETIKAIREKMIEFFKDEQLSLKYSRIRYSELLKCALCSVYIQAISLTIDIDLLYKEWTDQDVKWEHYSPYVTAMKNLFDNVKLRADTSLPAPRDRLAKVDQCIKTIDDLLDNLSFCIVVTENEDDAYKLFEVLNDRSLEIQDLELIKNHFYREYCVKSGEQDNNVIDANIAKLEEIWGQVFGGVGDKESRLISYLAAIYFTSNKDLDNKNDAKYKNIINTGYSSKYTKDQVPYTYDIIERDFNVYLAIRMLIQEFGLKSIKLDQVAYAAETKHDFSVTMKTMNLLHAAKQTGVMASLVSLILATYWSQNATFDDVSFKDFLTDLIYDSTNSTPKFARIHQFAHTLWTAYLRAKNYEIPREIAGSVISRFGVDKFDLGQVGLTTQQNNNLNAEYDKWTADYIYQSSADLKVKILYLRLLSWTRSEPQQDGYKASQARLVYSATGYQLNGRDVQLDHLEANNPPSGHPQYFMMDDLTARSKIINHNIGNFMILDAKDNNNKKNVPLLEAINNYYASLSDTWLIKDIKDMTCDSDYFDITNKIPKESFFTERTKRILAYFKALLNSHLDDSYIDVRF